METGPWENGRRADGGPGEKSLVASENQTHVGLTRAQCFPPEPSNGDTKEKRADEAHETAHASGGLCENEAAVSDCGTGHGRRSQPGQRGAQPKVGTNWTVWKSGRSGPAPSAASVTPRQAAPHLQACVSLVTGGSHRALD